MIGQYLLQQLNELRVKQVHCDLELISSDRTVFPMHQVVFVALNKRHFKLAVENAETGVFDVLSKKKMMLSCVDSAELRLLVDFMYGQTIATKYRYEQLVLALQKLDMSYLLGESGIHPPDAESSPSNVKTEPELTTTNVQNKSPTSAEVDSSAQIADQTTAATEGIMDAEVSGYLCIEALASPVKTESIESVEISANENASVQNRTCRQMNAKDVETIMIKSEINELESVEVSIECNGRKAISMTESGDTNRSIDNVGSVEASTECDREKVTSGDKNKSKDNAGSVKVGIECDRGKAICMTESGDTNKSINGADSVGKTIDSNKSIQQNSNTDYNTLNSAKRVNTASNKPEKTNDQVLSTALIENDANIQHSEREAMDSLETAKENTEQTLNMVCIKRRPLFKKSRVITLFKKSGVITATVRESSEKQAKSSEKQAESSEKQTESSEKQAKSSEKQAELSEKQAESSKTWAELSEKQAESSEKQAESSKKQAELSEKQAESSEKQNGIRKSLSGTDISGTSKKRARKSSGRKMNSESTTPKSDLSTNQTSSFSLDISATVCNIPTSEILTLSAQDALKSPVPCDTSIKETKVVYLQMADMTFKGKKVKETVIKSNTEIIDGTDLDPKSCTIPLSIPNKNTIGNLASISPKVYTKERSSCNSISTLSPKVLKLDKISSLKTVSSTFSSPKLTTSTCTRVTPLSMARQLKSATTPLIVSPDIEHRQGRPPGSSLIRHPVQITVNPVFLYPPVKIEENRADGVNNTIASSSPMKSSNTNSLSKSEQRNTLKPVTLTIPVRPTGTSSLIHYPVPTTIHSFNMPRKNLIQIITKDEKEKWTEPAVKQEKSVDNDTVVEQDKRTGEAFVESTSECLPQEKPSTPQNRSNLINIRKLVQPGNGKDTSGQSLTADSTPAVWSHTESNIEVFLNNTEDSNSSSIGSSERTSIDSDDITLAELKHNLKNQSIMQANCKKSLSSTISPAEKLKDNCINNDDEKEIVGCSSPIVTEISSYEFVQELDSLSRMIEEKRANKRKHCRSADDITHRSDVNRDEREPYSKKTPELARLLGHKVKPIKVAPLPGDQRGYNTKSTTSKENTGKTCRVKRQVSSEKGSSEKKKRKTQESDTVGQKATTCNAYWRRKRLISCPSKNTVRRKPRKKMYYLLDAKRSDSSNVPKCANNKSQSSDNTKKSVGYLAVQPRIPPIKLCLLSSPFVPNTIQPPGGSVQMHTEITSPTPGTNASSISSSKSNTVDTGLPTYQLASITNSTTTTTVSAINSLSGECSVRMCPIDFGISTNKRVSPQMIKLASPSVPKSSSPNTGTLTSSVKSVEADILNGKFRKILPKPPQIIISGLYKKADGN